MTIVSSLPLANHLPLAAHLTASTGPVCIVSVHNAFGGPFSSALGERIGDVDHIRILASAQWKFGKEDDGYRKDQRVEIENFIQINVWISFKFGLTTSTAKLLTETTCRDATPIRMNRY